MESPLSGLTFIQIGCGLTLNCTHSCWMTPLYVIWLSMPIKVNLCVVIVFFFSKIVFWIAPCTTRGTSWAKTRGCWQATFIPHTLKVEKREFSLHKIKCLHKAKAAKPSWYFGVFVFSLGFLPLFHSDTLGYEGSKSKSLKSYYLMMFQLKLVFLDQ